MRLVEQIHQDEHNDHFKTRYMKYRAGRLKHHYWLRNRKNQRKQVNEYDAMILKNCQPGRTAFFCSAGYYLRDIWPTIDSIEMHPVVREFYPDVILVDKRENLATTVPYRYDNFAVVNNRGDHWQNLDGICQHLKHYCSILNPGCRVFYSLRDTQLHYNRLTVHAQDMFESWARGLQSIGLDLVWQSIDFKRKEPDGCGNYDAWENPDTTNGNLKFWFVYQGQAWTPIT